MKSITRIAFVIAGIATMAACQSPPPGTVVFEDKSKAEEIVLKSHGISKDDFEGHSIIKIQTSSIGNPGDTASPYVPVYQRPADFR